MVEPVLHFFKIHRKVIFGNASVVVQDMLRKTPKSFNTVDVILASVGERFAVVQAVMFAKPLQRIVASEGIRVVHRALSCFLPNDRQKLFFRHMFDHLRIHLAVALQKAKDDVLAGSASAALALASAAEVALVHLYLAIEFATLQFRRMVDRFAQALVDAGDRLVVHAEVMRETVGRLLLVEPLHNGDFRSDALYGLLLSTPPVPTPHIPARGSVYLERTAKHALSAPQKVGRTTENILFACNHKGILTPYGYETH